MQKLALRLCLLLVVTTPLRAEEIHGQAATSLYNLMVSDFAAGNFPNIKWIKAVDDIRCAERIDNTHKCNVPSSQDGVIMLGEESSKMFYEALKNKGFSINLDATKTLSCTDNPISCTIRL